MFSSFFENRSIQLHSMLGQILISLRFIILLQLLSMSSAATPNPLHNKHVLSNFMNIKSGMAIKSPVFEKENINDLIEVATLEANAKDAPNIACSTTPNKSQLPVNNNEDMQQILKNALFFKKNVNNKVEILNKGWKMVHEGKEFMLWKRKLPRLDGSDGPIEYLMTGELKDISPFSFLAAQIHRSWRSLWDSSMKEMSLGKLFIEKNHTVTLPLSQKLDRLHPNNEHNATFDIGCNIPLSKTSDLLYYRTKWPWPLKDRDYTLSRRCQIFDEDNAFVFVSRSSQPSISLSEGQAAGIIPPIDGVIRVDNYWCQSVVFSTTEKYNPFSTSIQNDDSDDIIHDKGNNEKVDSSDKSFGDIVEEQWKKMISIQQDKQNNMKQLFPSSTALSPIQSFHAQNGHPHKRFALKPKVTHHYQTMIVDFPNDKHVAEDTWKPHLPSFLPINALNKPGLIFVTRFCDDQKMPLPSRLVDILASAGEKLVPESIAKLCEVARKMDRDANYAKNMNIPDADAGITPLDESGY